MSNLIITIIGIALAAITTILGIYYGGQAYTDYQAKSYASTAIADLQQLAASAKLYFTEQRGENPTFATGTWCTAVLQLVPNYLSNATLRGQYYNSTVCPNGSFYYSFDAVTGVSLGNPNLYKTTTAAVLLGDSKTAPIPQLDVDICNQFVNQLGTNNAAYSVRTGSQVLPAADLAAGKRWFCQYYDENSNGMLDTDDSRVYLMYMFNP